VEVVPLPKLWDLGLDHNVGAKWSSQQGAQGAFCSQLRQVSVGGPEGHRTIGTSSVLKAEARIWFPKFGMYPLVFHSFPSKKQLNLQ